MQKFFNKNKNREKTVEEMSNEIRVKEYINKYIKELQRHFDVSDNTMRQILYNVYKELCPLSIIKCWIFMLKSKYKNAKKEN